MTCPMGRSLAYLAHFAGAWLLPSAFWKSLISLKAHSSLNNQSIQRLLCTERAKIGITWNKHRAYCNTNRLSNLGTRLDAMRCYGYAFQSVQTTVEGWSQNQFLECVQSHWRSHNHYNAPEELRPTVWTQNPKNPKTNYDFDPWL